MRITIRVALVSVLTVVLTALLAAIYLDARRDQAPAAAVPQAATCTRYMVPVTVTPTDPTIYHIVGWLCSQPASKRHTTMQLLVSGLTYDHNYWDVTLDSNAFSYVHAANAAGWSTFAIDRLGIGESDKPPAELLTVKNQAYTVEQVIQRLRAGGIDGTAYPRVVGVGHSLGGGIVQYAAATAPDRSMAPDFVVVADFLSATDPGGLGRFAASLVPADTDPRFAGQKLPDGYLTTRSGTRGQTMYNPAETDPAVLQLDESLKQTGNVAERNTLADARARSTTRAVPVPTMLVVGQVDAFFCNATAGLSCADSAAVLAREAANYGPRACLRAEVVPGAGHASNLHRQAGTFFTAVTGWLNDYIYDGTQRVDANGCLP